MTISIQYTTSTSANTAAFDAAMAQETVTGGGNTTLLTNALGIWDDYVSISYSSSTVASANLVVLEGDLPVPGRTGAGYTEGGVGKRGVVIDKDLSASSKAFTYLHEIGHAVVGLAGHATALSHLSVMSDGISPLPSGFVLPTTPMVLDFRALQAAGLLNDINTGTSSYTLSGASKTWAIWDAGGTDVLDASAQAVSVKLDLRGGTLTGDTNAYWSEVGGEHVAIAEDSRNATGVVNIERALGGTGNDFIYGGGANNTELRGNAGNDQIWGDGDKGSGMLFGADTIYGDRTDTVGAGNDTLYGDNGQNIGADSTAAIGGADHIYGGGGNDRIYGEGANDTLEGEAGNDTMFGGQGNDSLLGGNNDDFLHGGDGSDTLVGGSGSDFLNYGNGADTIVTSDIAIEDTADGGLGNDVFYFDWLSQYQSFGTIQDEDNKFTADLPGSFELDSPPWFGPDIWSDSELPAPTIKFGSEGSDLIIYNAIFNPPVEGPYPDPPLPTYYMLPRFVIKGVGKDLHVGMEENALYNYLLNTGKINFSDMANGRFTVDVGHEVTGTSATDVIRLNANITSATGGASADTFVTDNQVFSATVSDFSTSQGDKIDLTAFDGSVTTLSALNITGSTSAVIHLPNGSTITTTGVAASAFTAADFVSNSLAYGAGVVGYGDTVLGDTIAGTSGDDAYFGNQGNDSISAGTGNDTLYGWTENDTLHGSYGQDFLGGDQSNDVLYGDGGNDSLDGGDGIDLLNDGEGNDSILGGAGDDAVIASAGADTIIGGDGFDTLIYSAASGAISLNLATGMNTHGIAAGDSISGVEAISGSSFADTMVGGSGYNYFAGEGGDDSLSGGDGDDGIAGGGGADFLDGGNGTDTLDYYASTAGIVINLNTNTASGGHAEDDTIFAFENVNGSAYADNLTGGSGANALSGNAGNDVLVGGAGADALSGGDGIDMIVYSGSSAAVTILLGSNYGGGGDAQGDTFSSIEVVQGSTYADAIAGAAGNEYFNGGSGNDTLYGADGADTLYGGAGADNLNGGNNTDMIDHSAASAAVVVDLYAGNGSSSLSTSDAYGDVYVSIENVYGSEYDDILIGNFDNNLFYGAGGNDFFNGYTGNDTISGGAGNDTFYFTAGYGADVVSDFQGAGVAGGDTIHLHQSGYASFSALQAASKIATVSGSTIITLSTGNSITLAGVTGLTAGDFSFS